MNEIPTLAECARTLGEYKKSSVKANDAEIRRRVMQEMQRRTSLDIALLSLQVGDGIVILQGEVSSIVELSNLAQAIRSIPAVNEFRSELTVCPRSSRKAG